MYARRVDLLLVSPRIPQKWRISGSLSVILVVFLITAVLVKVEMEPLPFFVFTMIKIICINCEYHLPIIIIIITSLTSVQWSSLYSISPLGQVTWFAFIMSKRWLEFTHML